MAKDRDGDEDDGDHERDPLEGSTEDALVDDLRVVRPGGDAVRMEDVRARAQRALFGAAAPARLGRFILLGPIAGGGMGVVYNAYDPNLDRRVALKLIHPHQRGTPQAHQRLMAEARALAKLDHPNIVPIHDVLEIDDQIVLVMELVAGQTLAAWERARAHTWREILAVYIEAGRGLAAVHRLGLAHRDFKPANAIVGDDGRVRVLDFGLVRFAGGDDVSTQPMGPPSPPASSLTATGEVLGTVGFMAPEQLRGGVATAASDQFSFCVALHRALHDVQPFAGNTLAELLASIEARRIDEGPRAARTPSWLRAVIARGLATDPAARFPSMALLLAQLEREHGWRRWRTPVAVGVAAAVVATAVAVAALRQPPPDPVAACDGGEGEVGAVWSPARGDRIVAQLGAAGASDAREIGERVQRVLAGYRDAWSSQHRDACVAHRRGTQSERLLDRRMACLRRRLGALAGAAGVIEQIDRASIDKALEVAVRLPPVVDCGDLALLEREQDPPPTLAERAQVETLASRLSRADSLDHAGRSAEALAEASASAAEARRLGYPPVLVDALLLEGRLRLFRRDFGAAHELLGAAEKLALERGMLTAAVIAGARRIYADGMEGSALESLLGEASVLEPLSRGLPGDRFARPLLLNNIGALHMARGERTSARAAFEAARKALVSVEAPDLELSTIDLNLALITADPAAREALARSVWLRLRDQLGPRNLLTIEVLTGYSRYVADATVALPLADEACRLYREFHAELIPARTECEYHQALLAVETGDLDRAAALRDEIVAFAAGSPHLLTASWRELAAGQVALQRSDALAALAHFEAVRARYAGRPDWWDRQLTAHALLGAARAERALGQLRAALAHLEEAAAIFIDLTALNEVVENHRNLVIARREAAEIRAALGPKP